MAPRREALITVRPHDDAHDARMGPRASRPPALPPPLVRRAASGPAARPPRTSPACALGASRPHAPAGVHPLPRGHMGGLRAGLLGARRGLPLPLRGTSRHATLAA